MSDARRDANRVHTLLGVDSIDGETPRDLEVDEATGRLLVTATISGGAGSVTIADGGDVAEGSTTDAVVAAGAAGTVSAKLRRLTTDLDSIKTSTGNGATSANQTNGTQQTKITDGTNVVGVLKADGTIASSQNATLVSGTGMSTATLTLNAGSPNTAWFDMINYSWLSIKILTNTTPATLTFQTAGEATGTNPSSVNLLSPNATATTSTTTSATGTFHGPRADRFFRVSSNVAGGNTVTFIITFYTEPSALQTTTVSQGGTWTVGANSATGSAVPANAFYLGIQNASTTNLAGVLSLLQTANTSGGSVLAAGMMAQLDDTSPTTITENNFGNVRISSDRSVLVTNRATTPTQTTVASSASNVTLLAANNARKGAVITNDSSAILYLKLGATASTTSYSVTIAGQGAAPFSYYEIPFGYVGIIDGIWASATGNARITEIS